MLLSFDTKNQIITRTDANRAIANSTDYFEVSVTFSANWNGYDKTICFKNGDTEINIMLVNNAVPKEAHLNLGVGTWKVSIIGIKGNHKILTNAVNLPVGASGYIGTTGPTPRVYEELLTIIQSLHTEVASEAALRSAVEQFVDENFHDIVISDVYSKSEIDSMIVTKTVNDLVYYWNKSQTYNRAEIEALIEAAIQGTYIVVQTLPTTDISTHAIYLVPKSSATTGDYYDEYINLTGTSAGWEHIGTTEIDLSNYYTKAEINALLDNKVDKVSGKGLSTNDYDNTAKSIVDGVTSALANKVDKETGKGLSTNDYDNTAKGIVDGVTAALAGKVDKETGKGLSTNDYDNTEKAKLAGIAENATKTEGSLVNGNIKINGTETKVYDDSEIKQDLSTSTATVEGNPLNFTTLTAQKAKETVISLEPIQDLHGYDHPWPAGGGKNKLPLTVAEIKALNSNLTWTGNSATTNGITFMLLEGADGSCLGINQNGTCTAYINFLITPFFDLPAGDYIISGARTTEDTHRILILNSSDVRIASTSTGGTFTIAEQTSVQARITISKDKELNNVVFYPMLRLATETDPTFAPYSNYCPIDGRTETSLVGCAKNLFDISTARSGYVDENGEYVSYSGFACSGYIRVNGDTSYIAQYNRLSTTPGRGIRIAWFDKNMTFIQRDGGIENTDVGIKSFTAVSPSNAKFAMVSMPSSGYAIEALFMIGSQPTTYEPYTPSNNLTIQFGEKVYGATVELEKGTVTVDKAIVDMGTLSWTIAGGSLVCRAPISDKKDGVGTLISSSYKYEPNKAFSTGIGEISDTPASSYIKNIFVKDSRVTSETTASQFASMVSGQQVCYLLATPYTITLTPNEISLLEGVNNISTDGDSIKLTYRDGKVATLGDLEGLTKKIADCEDVEITDLQDGHSLVYDSDSEKWINSHLGYDAPVIYSTEEREIGVWTDGKPLYQKTIVFPISDFSTTTAGYVLHGIDNIDFPVYAYGFPYGENSNYGQEIVPASATLSNTGINAEWSTAVTYFNRTKLGYFLGNQMLSRISEFYFTIQYTKTTDAPGSGKWTTMGVPTVHYDDTERVIGTWFGETLYQKVIDVPSFGSGYTSITHNLGIKNYVNAFGCCAVNGETDMLHNFPFIQGSNNCSIGVHGADSFSLVSSWNNCKAKICIQYTKNNS